MSAKKLTYKQTELSNTEDMVAKKLQSSIGDAKLIIPH